MGKERLTIASVLQVSSNHNEIPESQDYLDSRIESCFPGCSKSKRDGGRIPETPTITSFLQQQYNLQPIVFDWAGQSIKFDAYAYLPHNV